MRGVIVRRWVSLVFLSAFVLCPFVSAGPAREFQLQAESAQFWDLIDRDDKLETVATRFGFTEWPVRDKS